MPRTDTAESTTLDARSRTRFDAALAYADMAEAVEDGYLATATSLAEEYGIPLDLVWSPADDYLDESSLNRTNVAPRTSAV